jgi:hypothetical protein
MWMSAIETAEPQDTGSAVYCMAHIVVKTLSVRVTAIAFVILRSPSGDEESLLPSRQPRFFVPYGHSE